MLRCIIINKQNKNCYPEKIVVIQKKVGNKPFPFVLENTLPLKRSNHPVDNDLGSHVAENK